MRTGQQDRSWNRRSVGCRRPERWCLQCRPSLARREPACCHGIPSESTAPEPAPAFGPGGLAQPHPRCRASWGALNPRTSPGQRPGCSSRSLPAPPPTHTHTAPVLGGNSPEETASLLAPPSVCVWGVCHIPHPDLQSLWLSLGPRRMSELRPWGRCVWGILTSAFLLLSCRGLPDVQQVGDSAGTGLFWGLKRVPGETGLPNSPWAEWGCFFLASAFALGGGI